MKNPDRRNKKYFRTLRNSYGWRFVTRSVADYLGLITRSFNDIFDRERYESTLRAEALQREVEALHNKMKVLKNKYSGQRCFILGNGPSLRNTDLSLLKNEITFGSNRLYILFEELGFTTTFYLAFDPLVVEHYHLDIDQINSIKFTPTSHKHYFTLGDRVILLDNGRPLTFAYNLNEGVWSGGSVTYAALQLAFHMGFDKAILVGVDHSYDSTRSNSQDRVVKVSEGVDPNHFSSEYFGKGVSWLVPNLELKELGYRMAKYAFEADGREILDATIGGKLNVFPKVDYYSLFRSGDPDMLR